MSKTPRPTTAPPLHRSSMTPRPWLGATGAVLAALTGRRLGAAALPDVPWVKAAKRRRALLLAAVLGSAAAAAVLTSVSEAAALDDPLAVVHLALFTLMFAWVAAGFFTALMGFVTLVRGDRHALKPSREPIRDDARTAIVMPICNEDIATVFGGLRTTCASLAATGASKVFDVFILSDTSDPALRAAELRAWRELQDTLGAEGRVHYRWRRLRTKRKAGNVADFCRRWGAAYRYMVVLDADSVMSGEALVSLVRLMEANPNAGIVQSLPRTSGHQTLHARAQAFLGQVAGRLFSAGLAYWQLGESHYWGHNAIIRIQPFMKHCALAPLKGRGGLSGPILSHDFVEAALMRRAGYEVWLADLPGSYEQPPPHLIDELKRDRRWCQGNLQNARLIAEPGFAPVHRAMFFTGAMAYAASPLWLAFVAVGLVRWALGEDLSASVPAVAPALWGATLAMLLLPRVLGVAWVLARGEAASFGGAARLWLGALLEAVLATLQAPVRMAAHSVFVLGALTGLKLEWKSPSRDAVDVRWAEALSRFGLFALAATAALGTMAYVGSTPAVLLPVLVPLALAIPLAVWTSRIGPGSWLRRHGWLVIPEEAQPLPLLKRVWPERQPASVATSAPSVARPATALTPVGVVGKRARPAANVSVFLGRAVAAAFLGVLPIATLPTPEDPAIVFSYLAAMPAPFEERVAIAEAAPDQPLRKVSAKAKRPVVKRLPLDV